MAPEGTPLTNVPAWPKPLVRKLQDNWITTVEQLLAAGATPGGPRTLANHLGVSDQRMEELLNSARAAVAPHVAARLERPADAGGRGLGARRPRDDVEDE